MAKWSGWVGACSKYGGFVRWFVMPWKCLFTGHQWDNDESWPTIQAYHFTCRTCTVSTGVNGEPDPGVIPRNIGSSRLVMALAVIIMLGCLFSVTR